MRLLTKTLALLLKILNKVLKKSIKLATSVSRKIDFWVRYLEFVPRPDDIFIVTYSRSGTTWMQMILYQLATDGKMDFEHISQVSPWFEEWSPLRLNFVSDLESFKSPRLIKTHLPYQRLPKGNCKYIYVVRNGKDVVVSYYHFYQSHLNYKGTFAEFYQLFMEGKVLYGSWFDHVANWWSNRNNHQILFLSYEDLKEDLKSELEKLINFCGFQITPERFSEVMDRCSFEFMKQHETKFDFATQILVERGINKNSFIRKGKSGNWHEYLSETQQQEFSEKMSKYQDKLKIVKQ